MHGNQDMGEGLVRKILKEAGLTKGGKKNEEN